MNFSTLLLFIIKALEILLADPFLYVNPAKNLLILIDLYYAIFTLMFKTSVIFSLFGSGGMECLQHLLLEYVSFSRCHIWMDWNLQKLLLCVSLSAKSRLSDIYYEGYSGLFYKCAQFFQLKNFLLSIDELHQGNLNLLSISGCLPVCLLSQVSMK